MTRTPVTILARLLILVLALALPLGSLAQTPAVDPPDYARWEALARLAETSLAAPETADAVLESLRAEVSSAREQFLAVQTQNTDRVAILREQIAALGPPPAEDATEADEIAQRRAELNQRLAELQAPVVAADEAFSRAEAIIRSIDRQLRERQAAALLRLWPTPLDPRNWTAGAEALIESVQLLRREVQTAWNDPVRRAMFTSNLPMVLLALAAAALLILRGRAWIEDLTQRLLRSTRLLRGRVVAAFALSLGQILVPFLGLSLLYLAILRTGLASTAIADLAETAVYAGLIVVIARWLSLLVFPVQDDPGLPLLIDDKARRRGRGVALLLGLCSALEMLHGPFLVPEMQSDAANSVTEFPLIVLTALGLWRMGGVLGGHRPRPVDGLPGPARFLDQMIVGGARLLKALALVAPVLAAAGYILAATQLVYPAIGTLGVVGLVMVLHRLVTAIYEAVLGTDEDATDALVPALVGMVLTLAALPVVALVWGLRSTELFEIWVRFRDGFALGETRISPANILSFFVVFAVGYLLTRGVQGALSSSVLPKTRMDLGAQKAVVSGLGYVGVFAAALIAFSTAGIDLSGLAIVAGALSVGIGFGLQTVVSNFVSGLILLIERPVSEGDWVEVGATQGIVSKIAVRATMIETFDKSVVIVPNSDLISGVVTNYTKNNRLGRVIVPVSVAYGADTRRVEAILREVVEAHPLVAVATKPLIVFQRFGADGLDFEARAILSDVNFKLSVLSELNHQIAERFRAEGIEIPFPQRDLWLRNPETLVGAGSRSADAAPAPRGAAAGSPDRRQSDDAGDDGKDPR